jgi:hypothetical protein
VDENLWIKVVKKTLWRAAYGTMGSGTETRDSNEIMIRQHVGFEGFEYECVAQCTSGTLTTILH